MDAVWLPCQDNCGVHGCMVGTSFIVQGWRIVALVCLFAKIGGPAPEREMLNNAAHNSLQRRGGSKSLWLSPPPPLALLFFR